MIRIQNKLKTLLSVLVLIMALSYAGDSQAVFWFGLEKMEPASTAGSCQATVVAVGGCAAPGDVIYFNYSDKDGKSRDYSYTIESTASSQPKKLGKNATVETYLNQKNEFGVRLKFGTKGMGAIRASRIKDGVGESLGDSVKLLCKP